MFKNINENILGVNLYPVNGTRLLWRSEESRREIPIKEDVEFLKDFSLISRSGFFKDLARISENFIECEAERYGGRGLGVNGGGARVANIGDIQLKGIGANQLVGEGAPVTHSYGGLDVQAAIKEIVYTLLVNHISPVGAQDIHGLILLDRRSAQYYGSSSWSTILIRERCLRPGHYLRSPDFRVKPEFKYLLMKDEVRIKKIYRRIEQEIGTTKFLHSIYEYLDKSANQFSFCRIARFSHSVLSESNMAMDGRLLDTSACGFVYSGLNYSQVSDFFNEPQIPLQAAQEIVYLLNKYCYLAVDFSVLQQHYYAKFNEYLLLNAGYLFAIDHDRCLQLTSSNNWRKVVFGLNGLIVSGTGEKSYFLPTIANNDKASDILAAALYWSQQDGLILKKHAEYLRVFFDDFNATLNEIFQVYNEEFETRQAFLKSVSIQTLKRAYLSSFFYLAYVTQMSEDVTENSVVGHVGKVINTVIETIQWIFEDLDSAKCTLFRSSRCSIEYLQYSNSFEVIEHNECIFSTKNPDELYIFLKSADINFKVLHYNFKPFLLRLSAFFLGSTQSTFKGVKDAFE